MDYDIHRAAMQVADQWLKHTFPGFKSCAMDGGDKVISIVSYPNGRVTEDEEENPYYSTLVFRTPVCTTGSVNLTTEARRAYQTARNMPKAVRQALNRDLDAAENRRTIPLKTVQKDVLGGGWEFRVSPDTRDDNPLWLAVSTREPSTQLDSYSAHVISVNKHGLPEDTGVRQDYSPELLHTMRRPDSRLVKGLFAAALFGVASDYSKKNFYDMWKGQWEQVDENKRIELQLLKEAAPIMQELTRNSPKFTTQRKHRKISQTV